MKNATYKTSNFTFNLSNKRLNIEFGSKIIDVYFCFDYSSVFKLLSFRVELGINKGVRIKPIPWIRFFFVGAFAAIEFLGFRLSIYFHPIIYKVEK